MSWGSTADVLEVTNSAINQMTGRNADPDTFTVLDSLNDTAIIDLGEKLGAADENGDISVNSPADIFFKSLLSQVGKVVVDTRSYVAQLPKLFVNTNEWGLITEVLKTDLSDIMIDEMWNPLGFVSDYAIGLDGRGHTAEGERIAGIEFGTYKPAVYTRLYKKCTSVMVAITKSREQLFTAFRTAAEYENFVAALMVSVENALALKAEVYGLMCVSVGIVTAINHGNDINLLAEWNDFGNTLTAETALYDEDFLVYANMRIAETRLNLKRFTRAYNDHETLAFSADPHMILLNKFWLATKFNVRANTYNEQLIGVGDFDPVTSWQAVMATGDVTPFTFTACSSISLTDTAMQDITGNPEATATEYNGIIGVLYDRLAMGVYVDKRKVTSQYIATKDQTNYFHHSLINYSVNDMYPIVTFSIRDTE